MKQQETQRCEEDSTEISVSLDILEGTFPNSGSKEQLIPSSVHSLLCSLLSAQPMMTMTENKRFQAQTAKGKQEVVLICFLHKETVQKLII